MNLKNIAVAALVASCSSSHPPPAPLLAAVITAISVPGAVGDGIADDRAALQLAISATPAGATLTIPNGSYLVGQGAGSWCLTVPTGVTLRGESRSGVVLRQAGGIAGSVRLIEIAGAGAAIENMTLDGNRSAQTRDEHRAGIFVTAADVAIRSVTAQNFTGDGFYFYTGSDRFIVEDSDSTANDRDGMVIGGASAGGRIRRSRFVASRAQQLDSEPGATGVISELEVSGSTFDGMGESSDYAFTVSGGSPAAQANHWRIEGNVINGGLHVVWAQQIIIRGNAGINTTPRPHISIYRTSSDILIERNDLTSPAPNALGTVNLTATGEGGPHGVVIRGNRLVGDAAGVHAEGGASVEITDNDIIGPGVPGGGSGIYLRATDQAHPFAYALVRRNRISNFGSTGIRVDGNGAARISLLDVSDNVFSDTAGTMLGAMALNRDEQGAALDVRESGNVLLGGCVTKIVGLAPRGALTTGMGQRWN